MEQRGKYKRDPLSRRYASQTGHVALDRAINGMSSNPPNISRKQMGRVAHELLKRGSVDNVKQFGNELGVNKNDIYTIWYHLREYGIIIQTKELGNTLYSIDLERVYNPSPTKCVVVHRHSITKSTPKPEPEKNSPTPRYSRANGPYIPSNSRSVSKGRCPGCGCKPTKWEGKRCLLCFTKACVAAGTA
jgi:hypothetical protein